MDGTENFLVEKDVAHWRQYLRIDAAGELANKAGAFELDGGGIAGQDAGQCFS